MGETELIMTMLRTINDNVNESRSERQKQVDTLRSDIMVIATNGCAHRQAHEHSIESLDARLQSLEFKRPVPTTNGNGNGGAFLSFRNLKVKGMAAVIVSVGVAISLTMFTIYKLTSPAKASNGKPVHNVVENVGR